ncbi:MAG: cobalamin biosynthesis protein CobD [Syntrophus sp. (in: bacteria)]|nr:cobalamin biosynthesis protein CobD [Syntrophus sp. (in: bacteria)]
MEVMSNHIFIVILILAFFLDLIMGDPPGFPHPVRIIGRYINSFEGLLRKTVVSKGQERLAGVLLTTIIVLSTFVLAYGIEKWILFSMKGTLRLVGILLLIYLTATTLATKELIATGLKVIEAVKEENLVLARKHLGMIVGRDVEALDRKGILKAVIETLSENLSDGVIAPLFYLVIGGMPLGLAYKAINTLDSMVGYKNDKYRYFGWASARLDDIFNYIPARISGMLIAISSGLFFLSVQKTWDSFITMYHDGNNHSSPNSGYPEAAMAGALGAQLGGPSMYNGILVEKPYIGAEEKEDYLIVSIDTIKIIKLASFFGFFISVGVLFLCEVFI